MSFEIIDFKMLEKLLYLYNSTERNTNVLNITEVVEYEYSTMEVQKLIDLNIFRISEAKPLVKEINDYLEHLNVQ